MKDLTLYTYKNRKSLDLINLDNKKKQILSYLEIQENLDNELEYYVDITSIGDALKAVETNPGLILKIEQSLYSILSNNNIKFICKENSASSIVENLYLIFVGTKELIENDEKIEKANSKIEKIKIRDLTVEEFNKIIDCLNEELIGHENFKKQLKLNLEEFRLFNKLGEHKIFSMFIFGNSGIGKTQVARILHKSLAINEKMIKISFGNYSSQGSLNSLIGSPRGYIGSDDGELNTKIDNSRSSIILIDEFEKADKSIINFFLELLEEGKYTDMLGVEHDLDGYIIIFTSNINEKNHNEYLTPEFCNRLNMKMKFNLLNESDKNTYLKRRVNELINKYNSVSENKMTESDRKVFEEINVSKYDSIRDIEQQIKNKFIDLVKNNIEKKDKMC